VENTKQATVAPARNSSRSEEKQPCYTQPRSFIAVATRSMATMYAALRM
jgi:hypothetical protein